MHQYNGTPIGLTAAFSEDAVPMRIPDAERRRRQVELDSGLCNIDDWKLFLGGGVTGPVAAVDSVGVFVHIFYEEMAGELAAAVSAIPFDCRVYVSTSDEAKAARIKVAFQSAGIEHCVIKVLPNAGFDLGPLLFGFAEEIRSHDICLHLHSKKSSHQGPAFGERWRAQLLEELVGNPQRVAGVVDAFCKYADLGMLIPRYWDKLDAVTDPGRNWPLLSSLLDRLGISIDPTRPVHYPCGSMFWFRGRALEPLLQLQLTPADFRSSDEEQRDSTLAHAIERAFLYSAAKAGFSWACVPHAQHRPRDLAELSVEEAALVIRDSGAFDAEYYAAQHPGIVLKTHEAIEHYVLHSGTSDADPYAGFNTRFYKRLALHRDGWTGNPLVHYLLRGKSQGLSTAPDSEFSLACDPYAGNVPRTPIVGSGSNARALREFCASNVVRTVIHSGRPRAARLALFAMNETRGGLTAYRRLLLSGLRDAGFDIAIVNSSELRSEAFLNDVSELSSYTIIRRTVGRDFASWVTAHWELRDVIPTYEHVLWINDSIFGPYRAFDNLCKELIAADVDCIGLTDSWEHTYHLQSYFVLFKTEPLLRSPLRRFIQDYRFPDDKAEIIATGELGLTQAALDAGLSVKAQFPYSAVSGEWLRSYAERVRHYKELAEYDSVRAADGGHARFALEWLANVAGYVQELQPVNPTHFFWDTLIDKFGYPFLKKELLALNPANVPNIGSMHEVIQPISQAQFDAIIENLRSGRTGKAPPWQAAQPRLALA